MIVVKCYTFKILDVFYIVYDLILIAPAVQLIGQQAVDRGVSVLGQREFNVHLQLYRSVYQFRSDGDSVDTAFAIAH